MTRIGILRVKHQWNPHESVQQSFFRQYYSKYIKIKMEKYCTQNTFIAEEGIRYGILIILNKYFYEDFSID